MILITSWDVFKLIYQQHVVKKLMQKFYVYYRIIFLVSLSKKVMLQLTGGWEGGGTKKKFSILD